MRRRGRQTEKMKVQKALAKEPPFRARGQAELKGFNSFKFVRGSILLFVPAVLVLLIFL